MLFAYVSIRFTFPLGVFTVSTVTISKELPSLFFRVLGMIFSLSVVLLWIVVSAGTIRAAFVTKTLLFAPCAAEFEKAYNERKVEDIEKSKGSHAV